MTVETEPTLEMVEALAERFITHVRQRFDMEIEYAEETLSVLDHFVRAVVVEEGEGEVLPPGHGKRAQLIHLLAPTMGAYFGEVLRRVFPCHWVLPSDDPSEWLIRFDNVPLWLNPVGAAAEALADQEIEEWNGAVNTSAEETDALKERLAVAPPVPEDEFYAMATRFEVLQIGFEWLQERKKSDESNKSQKS